MIWWPAKLSPEVRSLLERERSIAVLPAAARARALYRARAALAAGVATRSLSSGAPSAVRWAVAAGLACVATVAAGAVAYSLGVRARPISPPVAAPPSTESPASHWSAGDEPLLDLLGRPGVRNDAGALGSRRRPGRGASPGAGARGRRARGLRAGARAARRARPPLQDGAAGGREGSAARQVARGARAPWRGPPRGRRVRSELPAQPSSVGREADGRAGAVAWLPAMAWSTSRVGAVRQLTSGLRFF